MPDPREQNDSLGEGGYCLVNILQYMTRYGVL